MARPPPPSHCANCGAQISARASACPECGADEQTGWRESSIYDGLNLPEEAWSDYSLSEEENRPDSSNRRVNGIAWYWWCAAVALLLILGLSALALG